MGKLYQNRTLLGNTALVIFLALLACLTLSVPVPAMATTLTEDNSLSTVLTAPGAAVLDENNNWITNGGTAAVRTTDRSATSVNFTIQVLTDKDFSSLWFSIKKGANTLLNVYGKDIASTTYKKIYGTVYYVYQFVYNWTYQNGLDTASNPDYTMVVYSGSPQLTTVYLDLEVPPPQGGGGGGGGGGTPSATTTSTTTETLTGTITSTSDGQATLTVDPKKIEAQVSDPGVTRVEFVIPADKAAKQGTVAVSADTLAKVFAAGKPAVVKVGDAQLVIPPGAVDLSAFQGQGVTLKISIGKGEAAAPGDVAYKVASYVFDFSIRAEAGGADKGGIASFAKALTLTLPYDPAKLGGVPEDYLGVYRLANGAWEYAGGRIDKASCTVSVARSALSQYAVMAYDKNFADMAGHWAEKDVKLVAARHIAAGVTANAFAPDASVSRAEFAAFLLRSLDVSEQKATGERFSDVAAGAWYAGAVETAAARGLVSGYPDGTFKPNEPITREEVATMVTRALALSGKPVALAGAEVDALLASFKDAADIGDWAKESVAAAVKAGIVRGRAADELVPKATSTRAEAVVMVKRFMGSAGML